jgi:hypothetical protein
MATRRGPMHHAACTAVKLRALGFFVVFGTSTTELGAWRHADQKTRADESTTNVV